MLCRPGCRWGTWHCGNWRAAKNEPNLLPLHGWEMPGWHGTQYLALLKQSGSLQKHKYRSRMHFSMQQCMCWGPAGKLHALKKKFFCFCCLSEHSKADEVSVTPKLSSWDNYPLTRTAAMVTELLKVTCPSAGSWLMFGFPVEPVRER